MPVLVDEKIHYTVTRMMHSRMFETEDMCKWLREMPLLYGVWHPYKQAVALVYRQFSPVFALLESTAAAVAGQGLRCHRKLVFMEKMVAVVLLASKSVQQLLDRRLRSESDPSTYQIEWMYRGIKIRE